MDKETSEQISRLNDEVKDLLNPLFESAPPTKFFLLLRMLVRGMRQKGCSAELILKNVGAELDRHQ